MADKENEGDQPKKKGGFDFSSLYPKLEQNGEKFVSHAGGTDIAREVRAELRTNCDMTAQEFVNFFIPRALWLEDGKTPIGKGRASELASDTEFLEKLIQAHPEFYSEYQQDQPKDKPSRQVIIEREEDEGAAEFLFRAHKDYDRRNIASTKAFTEKMMSQYSGLTGVLSTSGLDALARSASSAGRLSELLSSGGLAADPLGDLIKKSNQDILGPDSSIASSRPFEMPHIEPPMKATNQRLDKVATSIDEMRELYVQQATMQKSLNEVATEILDKFVTGSEAAAKSSEESLGLAAIAAKNSHRALRLAAFSIVVTAGTFVYSQFFDGSSMAQLEGQTEMVSVLREIRDQAKAEKELEEGQNQLMIEAAKEPALKQRNSANPIQEPGS